MAFSTLAQIRTGKLNPELGLKSDADGAFGTTVDRNAALSWAFAELWPVMARLVKEAFTPLNTSTEYVLATIRDVQVIDVTNTSGVLMSKLDSFRVYSDETTTPPIQRLVLPAVPSTSNTYHVLGYAPYVVPVVDADACDLPPEQEWVVVAGARAFLYRRQMNRHITSQRFQNENRSTAETVAELSALYNVARSEFQDAMNRNRRNLSLPKAANLRRA